MIRLLRFLFISTIFATVYACTAFKSIYDPDELGRTLDNALIEIPIIYLNKDNSTSLGGYFKDVKLEFAKISNKQKIPLVIYLHGCDGIHLSALKDMDFLVRNNYAVIVPDSFARKFRPKSCDHTTYKGGLFRGILSMRLAEARHTHQIVKTLPWVDKHKIFMMGQSEGGITTAKYSHGGLAGRIITGWTCHSGWPDHAGISGPKDEPILSFVASNDPWFNKPPLSGDCGSFMSFRPNSKSIVIDVSTPTHWVGYHPEVQAKILQFLKANRRP
jgi:poly(3-hydroxybutyrate) depolymerase